MARELKIGKHVINDKSPCYVIAEIGHNHKGDVEVCKKLFDAAKDAGAHAVKLQKRNNITMYTKAMYDQPYASENAYGPTYGTHRDALEFNFDQYAELKAYAEKLDITFFSTAFDVESADFCEKLDLPAYKIASGDLKSIPLLRHIAKKGKPIIFSTGGGTMEDVVRAFEAIYPINKQVAILQCTASYPANYEELNLNVITTFREKFPDTVIGLSAHDNGISMSVGAYVLGARIVEKHFTLNRTWKGTDHAFSLEPIGLQKMCRDLERIRVALGSPIKETLPGEKSPLMKMGKKVVTSKALKAGHIIQESDLCLKSPADGLSPILYDKVLGQKLTKDLPQEGDLSLDILQPMHDR
jgi:sialic acid synthase